MACGLRYGLSQQMSSFAPFGQGLGTGLVTSARALGVRIRAVDREEIGFLWSRRCVENLSYAIAVFGTVASLCFHKASIDIPLGLRRRNKLAVTDLETLRRLTDLRPHDQDVVCERVGMFRRYLGHFSSCRVVVIKRGCVRFRECCRWRHVHLIHNHGKNNRRMALR